MTKVLPGAEPFAFEGNDIGVLILHGFTGTTQSVRYVGDQLHRLFGFTVIGPRLAGHGTSPDEMETTGYLDWLESAEDAMHALAKRKKRVFVVGLSMGGTLSLNLAARFPSIVAGVIPINASVGILEAGHAEVILTKKAPLRLSGIGSDIKAAGVTELAYAEVPVACLKQGFVLFSATGNVLQNIVNPILVIQSREDHIVPPRNAYAIIDAVGSTDVRLLWLSNSYHVATLDNDKDLIVERAGKFITEMAWIAAIGVAPKPLECVERDVAAG